MLCPCPFPSTTCFFTQCLLIAIHQKTLQSEEARVDNTVQERLGGRTQREDAASGAAATWLSGSVLSPVP